MIVVHARQAAHQPTPFQQVRILHVLARQMLIRRHKMLQPPPIPRHGPMPMVLVAAPSIGTPYNPVITRGTTVAHVKQVQRKPTPFQPAPIHPAPARRQQTLLQAMMSALTDRLMQIQMVLAAELSIGTRHNQHQTFKEIIVPHARQAAGQYTPFQQVRILHVLARQMPIRRHKPLQPPPIPRHGQMPTAHAAGRSIGTPYNQATLQETIVELVKQGQL